MYSVSSTMYKHRKRNSQIVSRLSGDQARLDSAMHILRSWKLAPHSSEEGSAVPFAEVRCFKRSSKYGQLRIIGDCLQVHLLRYDHVIRAQPRPHQDQNDWPDTLVLWWRYSNHSTNRASAMTILIIIARSPDAGPA